MTSTASIPAVTGASSPTRARSGWPGVVVLMLAIFTLVTSEFLPASLLPLMASDFGITEGVAGQVVTATAIIGMIAGPGTALLFPRLDRKRLVVILLALAVLSNLLTAVAPVYWLVVIARLVLGAAIAGTWAMALAIASHLVEAKHLGRAMAIVNIGVAGATVAAVPLGALISSIAGWRTVFWAIAAATAIALVVFLLAMPAIPAAAVGGVRTLLAALRSRVMIVGLLGLALLVAGHFGSYTFIRTMAESVPGLTPGAIALLLAVFGIGGLVGNLLAGLFVDRRLVAAMITVPVVIGLSIIGFSVSTGSVALVFLAAALWGIGFGGNPTMSQTWISQVEPNRIEAAGGLFVFTFQFAIALGAAIGGLLVDTSGVQSLYLVSGIAALVGGALLVSTRRGLAQ
ncbi:MULTISPECIES: MFS transporter [unclassified Rathayibacter]|uniref:MFS transporter n=1 Tax=unclassified Rathayibacter TaxID=2609250 RepID=UPI0010487964|nr:MULTISPECIES: MFS transporter [unclassified Rathayibacter]TCL77865.1 DHA1 family purine ribonucleoside efflux pump-like MFS transporter [Rathayibacter sp. PhB192]TCM23792.1 DHA1 family purine ribonucleoside efflux pump-like MFS transporter [Rathayibacter sp. PhB179]